MDAFPGKHVQADSDKGMRHGKEEHRDLPAPDEGKAQQVDAPVYGGVGSPMRQWIMPTKDKSAHRRAHRKRQTATDSKLAQQLLTAIGALRRHIEITGRREVRTRDSAAGEPEFIRMGGYRRRLLDYYRKDRPKRDTPVYIVMGSHAFAELKRLQGELDCIVGEVSARSVFGIATDILASLSEISSPSWEHSHRRIVWESYVDGLKRAENWLANQVPGLKKVSSDHPSEGRLLAAASPGTKKPNQRRKRVPRSLPTARERDAWSAYERLRTYTAVGEELGISRQAASNLVKRADEILNPKARSVRARQSIPTDRRGQETIANGE